ncbi:MAG TPA: TolC family protein [Parachlamydiaceae bacterium]|nr:TolC family protein [Parachlamydiaceae bacterium]
MKFLLVGLFFFSCLSADSSYLLNDILTKVLLKNQELNGYNYDMRASDAKILQAGLYINPWFDVETENINAPVFRQTTYLLSQLIELGNKRKARLVLATKERDKIFLDYEVKKRELLVQTALLFIEVLGGQQKVSFLEENFKVLNEFSSVVEKRVEAGKASLIEEANFVVLLNTARIDLQSAKNELKNAQIRLASQWGETNEPSFFVVGSLEELPDVLDLKEMGSLLEEHPQVVRFYFEEAYRDAEVSSQISKSYPDINLRGGPRYLEEAKKWVWVFGLTMPLPINDRNQGRILEALENKDKLEKEREAVFVKLLSELNSSYVSLQNAFQEILVFKDFILPAAQKAYGQSYKGYHLARYNYLELLETERAYRSSKMRYLQVLGEYHKALTIIQGLTGLKAIRCEES